MSSLSERIQDATERPIDHSAIEASLDDPRLIDCHVHAPPEHRAYPDFHGFQKERTMMTPERLIDWMNEHGIDQSVLLPIESNATRSYIPTWLMLEYAARYPRRFIPFCVVDPKIVVMDGEAWVERVIEEYVSRGARGFGELRVDLPIDDERMQLLYRICEGLELPMLIHTEAGFAGDEVGFLRLEHMLAKYPDLDVILHHYAWWAHMGAEVTEDDLSGNPSGPIEEPGRVDELLSTYDNVYADLSSPSGFNALTRDMEYGQSFLERHADRLIWGTDKLFWPQRIPHFALFALFELDAAAWEHIRFRNLEQLLV